MKVSNIKNILFLLLLSLNCKLCYCKSNDLILIDLSLQMLSKENTDSINIKNKQNYISKNLTTDDLLSLLVDLEKHKKDLETKIINVAAQISSFDMMIKELTSTYKKGSIVYLKETIELYRNFFGDFHVDERAELFSDCMDYIQIRKQPFDAKQASLNADLEAFNIHFSMLYLQLRESDLRKLILPFGNLSGICLSNFNLEHSYLPGANLVATDFSRSNLSETDFQQAEMSFVQFDDSILVRSNFSEATLRRASFARANLTKACFDGADLMGANLRYCILQSGDLRASSCLFANFSNADLSAANLESAHLGQVVFVGTNLQNAKLCGAKLMRANLMNADLRGADLSGADLSYANLNGALLDGANLENVILDKTISIDKDTNTAKFLN